MTQTILKSSAAQRLRRGLPWVLREEIASVEGVPPVGVGGIVELLDEDRRLLGVGDLDLEASVAAWRLGLPGEEPSGILARHLRQALDRRAQVADDPRYCRLVNGAGDGLPGLAVDRYDGHLLLETFSPAMEGRMDDLVRELRELLSSSSVVQRSPGHLPRTRYGSAPRWARVLELGARLAFDLTGTPDCGYPYDAHELRRTVARLASGARVLDLRCGIGSLLVHAGRGGARSVLALEQDPDQADLARENAEANGLWGRTRVLEVKGPPEVDALGDHFDLVMLTLPDAPDEELEGWLSCAMQAASPGGRLALLSRALTPAALTAHVARISERLGRWAICLATPGLPAEFPAPIRLAALRPFASEVVELSR